ncbi:hypothetical protein L4C36_00395 [Photobacterium japonica]|uniref:hypothetical protein n=1 Tax=Photobacterium japonica TaxID=2910235 RepID=UPI003D14ED01
MTIAFIGLLFMTSFYHPPLKKSWHASVYKTFDSPDNRYRVEVFMYKQYLPVMPGSGAGDAPGFIQLYDANNQLLEETDVEMVQLIETVEWSNTHISIPLITDWALQ